MEHEPSVLKNTVATTNTVEVEMAGSNQKFLEHSTETVDQFVPYCSCGWQGEVQLDFESAVQDGKRHVLHPDV